MRTLFAAIVLLCCAETALAIGPNPADDWKSAETPHFRVHYRADLRARAERVAAVAERVYPRITQQLKWEPRGRTEVVVFDEFDLANGFSSPLPFNTLGIFLASPDDGELLDNSAWLELVIAHEFTHTVHLDKVRGAPQVLQWIFGRVPLLFPNALQPLWSVEGLAVANEGDVAAGRGRLRGPMWEALLRIEREQGFKRLAEINASGRAWPISKPYLYGAYFYEFLARRYGADAVYNTVHRYSGNVVPRFHTNPVAATGKTVDVLWDEFIADLTAQVDARAAPIKRTPEQTGERLLAARLGPIWQLESLVPAGDGAVLAVIDDGIGRPRVQRIDANGGMRALAPVNQGARIDAHRDGAVLIAQPEICANRKLYFDLYELDAAGKLRRLTTCARYRRAVYAGDGIAALKNDGGRTVAVLLDRDGGGERPLTAVDEGFELTHIAASADRRIALAGKRDGRWSLLEVDAATGMAAQATAAPARVLVMLDAPVLLLRYASDGALEFVAARDGVFNVWRLPRDQQQLVRLTHTHTGVVEFANTADGALVTGVLAPGGVELRRLTSVVPQETVVIASTPHVASEAATDSAVVLAAERNYSALRTLYPRSWLPAGFVDRGLSAFGASTFGADALGWHQYIATVLWETSQKELIGVLDYAYDDRHFFSVLRELNAVEWTGPNRDETTTVYDRSTHAQWVSTLPWLRLERRVRAGVGAAVERRTRVRVNDGVTTPEDRPLAAAFVEIDTRGANWFSEGTNRGYRASLLYETYKPFSGDVDGSLVRLDGTLFVPIGRTAIAARLTEARAQGSTEPYQLGGAIGLSPALVPELGERDLALRGYSGHDPQLRGRHARVASLEWRTPIADIDRHAMVPPIGINRLSATLFVDAGGAWASGSKPDRYFHGVGAELIGEVRLLYAFVVQLRAGIARGIDAPGTTRGYLQLGRSF